MVRLFIISILLYVRSISYSIEYEYGGILTSLNWGTNDNQVYFEKGIDVDSFPRIFSVTSDLSIYILDSITHYTTSNWYFEHKIKVLSKDGVLLRNEPDTNQVEGSLVTKTTNHTLIIDRIYAASMYYGIKNVGEDTKYNIIDSAVMDNNTNLLGLIRYPRYDNDVFSDWSTHRLDPFDNIYTLRRNYDGIYIMRYAKIHYWPIETNYLNTTKILLAGYNHKLAYINNSNGLLVIGAKEFRLVNFNPNPIAAGYDGNGNLYIVSKDKADIYDQSGKKLSEWPITNEMDDFMINEHGLVMKVIDKQGLHYFAATLSGIDEVEAGLFTIKGYSADKMRIATPKSTNMVDGFQLKFDGNILREFKYGCKDILYSAKVLSVDEKNNIWVKTVLMDHSKEMQRGEVIKFNSNGNYQNRIYLNDDPKGQTVVANEREVYHMSGTNVIRFEKEKFEQPDFVKISNRVIAYLNKKKYEGGTRKYDNTDMTLAYETVEDLFRLGMDLHQFLINEIYSRNGYRFKEAPWGGIFPLADWYQPKDGEVKLNEIEQRNVNWITEPWRVR